MTPEDRVERLRLSGAPINPSDIVESIRDAEREALERAALAVDDAFNGDYHGKPVVERIRALKHSDPVEYETHDRLAGTDEPIE